MFWTHFFTPLEYLITRRHHSHVLPFSRRSTSITPLISAGLCHVHLLRGARAEMLVQECARACVCVWRVTPDISFDLAKVTVVVSGLHLTLPRSWLLQLFFPPVALEEWADFHHICLTADQLVLTQPLLARSGRSCCELPGFI